jgi:hypothetical protein
LSTSLAEIDALAAALKRRDATEAQRIALLHVENACVVAMGLLEEKLSSPAP